MDESTFMTGHAVRALVRRPIGTAFEEKFIVEKAQSGRRPIPVFGTLCSRGTGPLVRIEGRFDAEKYIEILDETVLPFVEDNFPDGDFYYYQDNSPTHRANIVRQWFDHNLAEYQLIQTPAKSPDINPIENLWGRAKVKVANDGIYANEEDLWLSITDSWLEMQNNMQYAVNLIDSIPNRLEAIINANGSYTKY